MNFEELCDHLDRIEELSSRKDFEHSSEQKSIDSMTQRLSIYRTQAAACVTYNDMTLWRELAPRVKKDYQLITQLYHA